MSKTLPWVEKYRATSLEEIQDQDNIIQMIRGIIAKKIPMNIIFVGPSGTGKTSIAKIILKSVLGNSESNIMEVNASDRVRMNFVRTELKDFVFQFSINGMIKAVLMEEADNIPSDPQQALRRIIEASYKQCRFILTCNYLSNIIPPIRSRCMIIRLKKISSGGMERVILNILDNEGLSVKGNLDRFLTELHVATDGDMRLMINTLQSCDLKRPIHSVREMLGIIKPIVLKSICSMIKKGSFGKIITKLNVMNKISPRRFLLQIGEHIVKKEDLSPEELCKVCKLIAEYDLRLTLVGSQEIQLMGFLAKLCFLLGGNEK